MFKKKSISKAVEKADSAKKANPLDLSSDQDLTIALMNLAVLERNFGLSGELMDVVSDIRQDLMKKIVAPSSDKWEVTKYLLAESMQLMVDGNRALDAGKNKDAYALYNRSYELYSLFWGINMGLISVSDAEKLVPDMMKMVKKDCLL